ncbi:TetR/AcrR family transcriptional regulator [Marichromatium gracile]|uniref:TetR family transcriptional regulator n=1 Tax=Marichromatium gracile TaxID=1048 RepID=A0A4V2WAQ6_MARGR|nr:MULTISPECIES: TetR/AcrR family transcriptional regulator [Marichromatium]MBO8086063.1 TetR/AcrR family transcriptional regulator [Marichromatium sp.]KXX65597.1 TetR family transcriptional regulator [Marichromatium gracile]MBK1709588.1 TetR/AcrR family transcriptional regulator [Marichromatium gracile]MCF1183185.1 TetR/AcrR family transcriptional regulator [Marichromatium gracile]RNE88945.1 TetR/AcrR family transcriptional regulator [Marichromatium sp. AB31]
MPQPTATPEPRCEARRRQILAAAAVCFAREGFHGASIAKISRAAEMSPGHIYHFFENKEAIIAALVEHKLEQSLSMVQQFERAEDVHQAMQERVDTGVNERTDLDHAALELEILAEAARNPRVAAIVQAADAAKRERLCRLLASARGTPRGDEAAATEIIMALFDGLASRAISNPTLDRAALLAPLQAALRVLS